jgi:phage host-nuclease inhibitor protein Gam
MMESASGETRPEFFTRENIHNDIKKIGEVAREALKLELKGKYFAVTTNQENGWIVEKHYATITGKERILPTMYTITQQASEEEHSQESS